MLWFDFELYMIHLISSITNYIEHFFATLNSYVPLKGHCAYKLLLYLIQLICTVIIHIIIFLLHTC